MLFTTAHAAIAAEPAFQPFATFYQSVLTTSPDANGVTSAKIAAARQHVLSLYTNVNVTHSYLLDGQHFDCVPVNQQPSVKALGIRSIASPPPVPAADPLSPAEAKLGPIDRPGQQLPSVAAKDAAGNAMQCKTGTIPMRRVTLEEIGRFDTLQDFFRKGPGDAGQVKIAPPAAATHKYAHATTSNANYGGTSFLNLWNPTINSGLTHIFSLSQHWYINFNGSKVQTVEGGWQHYPGKYGATTKSVLFIYWTADGYNVTGCYNLDCAGFVQTDNTVHLGAGWTNYSVQGGAQYSVRLTFWLFNGKWWIGYGDGNAFKWIGYYPGSLYGTGLLKTKSKYQDLGGETVGTTNWPGMGGSAFANQGFSHAAYNRKVRYITNTTGTSMVVANSVLTAKQPSPSCYTDEIHNNSSDPKYLTYFYFGGPGGTGC